MFFDDPVRAFTNIRHALTTDAVPRSCVGRDFTPTNG